MKVLIADDDPAARFALKRAIVRDFAGAVTEVDNGLDALESLSRQRYSLVLLDVQMPLMDGLETLRAIRANPELGSTPVVIMTVVRNEAQVQEIIELGVLDYLVKPLRLDVITGRLRRVATRISSHSLACAPKIVGDCLDGPVMIVDGDAEFRHYFTDLLSTKVPVQSTGSGAQALKLCLAARPHALFIGSDIGALGPGALVRKIRSMPQLSGLHLIAVAPNYLRQDVLESGEFDDVVPRSFVPEVFQRHLDRLSGTRTPLQQVIAAYPRLRLSLISATEQVFGMMMSLEVALQNAVAHRDGEEMRAVVTIALPGLGVEVTFQCRTDATAARQFAGRLTASDWRAISAADAGAALGEIANIITGRLHKAFVDQSIAATCTVPVLEAGSAAALPNDSDALVLSFVEPSNEVTFTIDLIARQTSTTVDGGARASQDN